MPLEVGNRDFKLDLLFYHFKLRCFVVVELKAVPFEPAFVGHGAQKTTQAMSVSPVHFRASFFSTDGGRSSQGRTKK